MITLQSNPRSVRVGHWHIQRQEVDHSIKHGDPGYIKQPYLKEVRFDTASDYIGKLHGFGVEGEQEELYCFALVEKPDGTFATPSATVIQLL